MRYPVHKVYITQKWGVNEDIYKRFGFKGHNGIDLRMFDENGNRASTAKLYAPHSGKVVEKWTDSDGYGKYLKIENDQEGSILAHLKERFVNRGEVVKEGQVIGICDNTGWSTGPHLHWGYYRKPRDRANGYGGTINPRPYIKSNEDSMKKYTEEEMSKMRLERDENWGLYQKAEQDLKKCELSKSQIGEKIKEAKDRIVELKEDLETEKRSKAQMVARSEYNQLVEEKEKLEIRFEELENKPTLQGKRKLLSGLVAGLLVLTSVILDKLMGLEISPQELLTILAGPVAYIGAEGIADILRIIKGEKGLLKIEKTDG